VPLFELFKILAPILITQINRPCRYQLWWQRHCFSAFKVSAKNGSFLGQMTGKSFEWSLKGYIRNDLRMSHFLRLRTLAASGVFWILFLAVVKEYLA
jgi:hypothetical protein